MYLATYTGKLVNIMSLRPDDISIHDIAHSLSHLCRYGGHCIKFYSVAQHSVRVARALPAHLQLAGLLHDASEAYVVDLPRPVKLLLKEYKNIEIGVQSVIAERFNLGNDLEDPLVKEADDRLLVTEWQELMPVPMFPEFDSIKPLEREHAKSAATAKREFLEMYKALTK
jgi:hypothetical protein